MTKRVWILTETYYPEEVSTSYFVTGVAEELARQFEVCVITSQPTYARRGERHPKLEFRNGVRIERCAGTTWDKNFLPTRIANALTLSISIMGRSLSGFGRGDVVLTWTNPPFLPWVVLAACRAKRARCLVRVDDVYPDAAVAAGLLRAGGISARAMELAGNIVYTRVDGIILMGRCMWDLIRRKVGPRMAPTILIPSWADVDNIAPGLSSENSLRAELRLQEKFVIVLAGNLGRVQGLEIVVEAAKLLLQDTTIHFLIVGAGAKELWLKEQVQRLGLTNVTVTGRKPPSQQNIFLTAGDVALITLAKGMVGVGVPSRLYNCMAAGVPIIVATGQHSEPSLVVQEENIGWTIEPEDGPALAEAIRDAKQSRIRLRQMGERARLAAETRYGYKQVVQAYTEAVGKVFSGTRLDK